MSMCLVKLAALLPHIVSSLCPVMFRNPTYHWIKQVAERASGKPDIENLEGRGRCGQCFKGKLKGILAMLQAKSAQAQVSHRSSVHDRFLQRALDPAP